MGFAAGAEAAGTAAALTGDATTAGATGASDATAGAAGATGVKDTTGFVAAVAYIIATLMGPRHRRHSGSKFWRTRPHVALVTIVTPGCDEYCLHSRPGGGALGGGVFGAFGST